MSHRKNLRKMSVRKRKCEILKSIIHIILESYFEKEKIET